MPTICIYNGLLPSKFTGPAARTTQVDLKSVDSAIPGLLEVTGAIEGFSSVGVAVWTGGEVSFGACTEVEIR